MFKGIKVIMVLAVLAWTTLPVRVWAQEPDRFGLPKDDLLENIPGFQTTGKWKAKACLTLRM